jgi:hypothetical protein
MQRTKAADKANDRAIICEEFVQFFDALERTKSVVKKVRFLLEIGKVAEGAADYRTVRLVAVSKQYDSIVSAFDGSHFHDSRWCPRAFHHPFDFTYWPVFRRETSGSLDRQLATRPN